jgi:hypothetical protein
MYRFSISILRFGAVMRTAVLLIAVSFALCACTIHEFTSDATARWKSPQIVGSCFELRRDEPLRLAKGMMVLGRSKEGALAYDGFFRVVHVGETIDMHAYPPEWVLVTKGSRFHVERVLAEHEPMVGTILKPFVRLGPEFGNILVAASDLFEFPFTPDDALKPIGAFVQACT